MVISNEQKTRETGLRFFLFITFFVITLLASLFIEKAQFWWLQYPTGVLILTTILIYRFGGYHYVNASFNNGAIEIKFYNYFPYGRKFRMLKLNTNQIEKLEIKKGFLGIGKGFIIYQKTKGSVAKYPFVGLSSVNSNDRNRIIMHLKGQ